MSVIFGIWNTALLCFTAWKPALHMSCTCWKLACSSLIFESTAAESLLRKTTQKTLLRTDKSVIALQFWHSARFPFLGNFDDDTFWLFIWDSLCLLTFIHEICYIHYHSIFSTFQQLCCDLVKASSFVVFQSFYCMSCPFFVISSKFRVSSLGESSMLKLWVTVRSGWFRVSLKCSIQCRSCSFLSSRILPLLSLIGVLGLLLVPVRSHTMPSCHSSQQLVVLL